ncbi:hypothetical protein Q0F98_09245 [Paenibacillus amylolyticus]|nr:hypothetical protein Q0F98_09245 [Paenibacillus amylolyticus]
MDRPEAGYVRVGLTDKWKWREQHEHTRSTARGRTSWPQQQG